MKRLRCRGIAAIEAALVMFATTSLLVVFVHCGRMALNCAAIDRAASSAARYIAAVPLEILHDPAQRANALGAAQAMVDEALAAAHVDMSGMHLDITCDGGLCSSLGQAATPGRVGVQLTIQFHDDFYLAGQATELSSYAEASRDN